MCCRAVRAAHAKDLQSRTELEILLSACVDDVRKELAAAREKSARKAHVPIESRPTSAGRPKVKDKAVKTA
ncbi:MAG: hypothetical protein SGPRY_009800, partial [Prymnesium sp.]